MIHPACPKAEILAQFICGTVLVSYIKTLKTANLPPAKTIQEFDSLLKQYPNLIVKVYDLISKQELD